MESKFSKIHPLYISNRGARPVLDPPLICIFSSCNYDYKNVAFIHRNSKFYKMEPFVMKCHSCSIYWKGKTLFFNFIKF